MRKSNQQTFNSFDKKIVKTDSEDMENKNNLGVSTKFKRLSKRGNFTNIWEFILRTSPKNSEKLRLIIKKLILHVLAIIFSFMVVIIQIPVNNICYLYPICDCQNNL